MRLVRQGDVRRPPLLGIRKRWAGIRRQIRAIEPPLVEATSSLQTKLQDIIVKAPILAIVHCQRGVRGREESAY